MLERSEQQNELAGALARAQAAIRSAEKDRANPHLRNRYATLESVIRATRGPLGDNGLSLTCAPVVADGSAGVAWTLRHASGQYESGALLMPMRDSRGVTPAQAVGSVVTYA
ncbi:ERF family protein, partial [Herbaspirillum sp.]|uniref:ERF family protein n=1 Tax=Herbaspirillum sp. TaxID=1890675 RepID=UPI000C0D0552